MKRFLGAILMTVLVSSLVGLGRAGEGTDVQAVLDKGIKALGGAEKLGAKANTLVFIPNCGLCDLSACLQLEDKPPHL